MHRHTAEEIENKIQEIVESFEVFKNRGNEHEYDKIMKRLIELERYLRLNA